MDQAKYPSVGHPVLYELNCPFVAHVVEARSQSSEGTEASVAECSAESLAPDEQWMERICQRENLWQALKRVKRNGGSPGIDGMTVVEFPGYLKQHWLKYLPLLSFRPSSDVPGYYAFC